MEFLSFLMRLSKLFVLWQDRGDIQKIALFGKSASPYYGKNSSNKQSEMTVHHYFKTWRSVNLENVKNFESFFKCSRKNHQVKWWNWLSRGPPQKKEDPELPLLQRISSWIQPQCLCEMQSRWQDDQRMCGSHHEAWRRCDGVGVLCWWQCWWFTSNSRHT